MARDAGAGAGSGVWPGEWVESRLGVELSGPAELRDLVGLALRRNPRRAHLLVSTVLGKHVPQRPSRIHGAGLRLGGLARDLLGPEAAARAVVLGYAETATGLGHCVADGLGASAYLHSTRRAVPGVQRAAGFEEEHSHATEHLLLPADPALLTGEGPLVLVDDELSTGRTLRNTITALHAARPRARYVVAALTDMRSEEDRRALEKSAADLGTRVDVVSLTSGTVRLPPDVLSRGAELVAQHEAPAAGTAGSAGDGPGAAGGAPGGSSGGAAAAESGGGRGPVTGPADAGGGEHEAPAAEAAPTARDAAGATAPGPAEGAQPGPADAAGPAAGTAAPGAIGGRAAGRSAPPPAGAPSASGTPSASGAPSASGGGLPEHPGGSGAEPLGFGKGRGRGATAAAVRRVALGWPGGLPDGGRHGFGAWHRARLDDALPGMAGRVAGALGLPAAPAEPPRLLVLGTEELMYAPLRLATALEDLLPGADVRFSSTTRSPVLPVDHPGYAIRSRLTFPAHDTPGGTRYAYNVTGDDGYDAVVVVTDSAADTPALHAPGGLLDVLAPHTDRVLLAVIPSYVPPAAEAGTGSAALAEPLRGPAFSSYAPDDVGWLLKDLSDVALEAPTEEREEAIQRGGAHYAESLPVEYQPSPDYVRLFHTALDATAGRIADAVATVTETVLAERSPAPVLVSLARAGTPVGILMRRWARYAHGLDLPHYAVSIVRGRGIDTAALRRLAAHHDPADVVFVDGWTGKGAIARELAAALGDFPAFDPRLAVLADPGRCVDTYGTREDFLIPSACLNSTVSGLISRTVLRADLIGPADYHGAKFYRELAGDDLSGDFLDAVTARFPAPAAVRPMPAAAEREPTWAGWAAVERISEAYGIGDVNLVKPGVGETTRVMLRRVPWRVLARRGAGADLDHVRLLAEQRGVPVEETDDLPYTCVGLIHPRYTRGATGADGTAAATAPGAPLPDAPGAPAL
ncbi:phosphoribosyltransferase [Streptomyces sp. NBC_01808]|uniref:phosphoribosyltransferase n=1 Tax=Streptomyces sp. NBC_01808 TaxID=2975947 RepID=UPI002DD7F4EB|nr:phosphoribosyltransferase [Streptomyces sp. NBC_01808]WSA37569.1 phosphoribosyltransferase [Streptomyces sp. NBC_01808]